MYPETKCLNCQGIIPERKRKKKFCNSLCSVKFKQTQEREKEKEKLLWKSQWAAEKIKMNINFLKANNKTEELNPMERWGIIGSNSSQEALRELAGLKTIGIKQAETCEELFALMKG